MKRPKQFQIVSGAVVGKKLTDFKADNIRVELTCDGKNKVNYFFQNVQEADIIDKYDSKTKKYASGGGKILKPYRLEGDYLAKDIKLNPASVVLDNTKMTVEESVLCDGDQTLQLNIYDLNNKQKKGPIFSDIKINKKDYSCLEDNDMIKVYASFGK